jgi:flagellar basal body-associated protein FliL
MKKKSDKEKSMLKNRNLIITISSIVLLLLIILLININITGKAIDPANPEDPLGLGINPEKIQEKADDPASLRNETTQYLKKEWGLIVRNESRFPGKYIAFIFKGYDKASPYTDPVFKYSLGMVPTLTWLFLLVLLMWILLFKNINMIIADYSSFSKGASFFITLCLLVIAGNLHILEYFAKGILYLIGLTKIWWVQLIVVIVLVLIIILLFQFSEQLQIAAGLRKEKAEKKTMRQKIEELDIRQEGQEKFNKNITKAFGGSP